MVLSLLSFCSDICWSVVPSKHNNILAASLFYSLPQRPFTVVPSKHNDILAVSLFSVQPQRPFIVHSRFIFDICHKKKKKQLSSHFTSSHVGLFVTDIILLPYTFSSVSFVRHQMVWSSWLKFGSDIWWRKYNNILAIHVSLFSAQPQAPFIVPSHFISKLPQQSSTALMFASRL